MELVDLNGLEPQPDPLTEGNEAHTLLQAKFMADYGASGGQAEYYVNSGITTNISGTGRADIVYFNSSTHMVEVYEIKPGSYSPGAVNYPLGICQLDGYIIALRGNGQIKSEKWNVARGCSLNTYFNTMVIDSVEYENMEIVYKVYENGLINYYYRKKQQPNQVPAENEQEEEKTDYRGVVIEGVSFATVGAALVKLGEAFWAMLESLGTGAEEVFNSFYPFFIWDELLDDMLIMPDDNRECIA